MIFPCSWSAFRRRPTRRQRKARRTPSLLLPSPLSLADRAVFRPCCPWYLFINLPLLFCRDLVRSLGSFERSVCRGKRVNRSTNLLLFLPQPDLPSLLLLVMSTQAQQDSSLNQEILDHIAHFDEERKVAPGLDAGSTEIVVDNVEYTDQTKQKQSILGWLWDTADLGKEERRLLLKLDTSLLVFASRESPRRVVVWNSSPLVPSLTPFLLLYTQSDTLSR